MSHTEVFVFVNMSWYCFFYIAGTVCYNSDIKLFIQYSKNCVWNFVTGVRVLNFVCGQNNWIKWPETVMYALTLLEDRKSVVIEMGLICLSKSLNLLQMLL